MSQSAKFAQLVAEEKAFHRASISVDEMPSCTTLFDKWASCFALGQQVKAVYRYGAPQDCKDKLDDFKFCLTLKSTTQEEKYDAWIQRKAEKTATKRMGEDSSESVWEMRRDTTSGQSTASSSVATIF